MILLHLNKWDPALHDSVEQCPAALRVFFTEISAEALNSVALTLLVPKFSEQALRTEFSAKGESQC